MKNDKADIVGVGACVMDTLITLPRYPEEDTKLRASATRSAGGGPVSTGLIAAAKLGVGTAYIGNLSADGAGDYLVRDFEKYGVDTSLIQRCDGHRAFTSVIWLSEASASRTCVFDRGDLPTHGLTEADRSAIAEAKVLMVDGNDMECALCAARWARECGTTVLYDCGGLYEDVDKLLSLTDIMIPSEEFALGHTGERDVERAAAVLFERYSPRVVVITCGKKGGLRYDGKVSEWYPAFAVSAKDTNGSGDVFHGAYAAGLVMGLDYEGCCILSSATSAIKCMGTGARESAPDLPRVKDFLKERGYEL